MTTYEYSLSGSFTSGLDIPRFDTEVRASSISVVLDGVTAMGDVVSVVFRADLSTAEKTLLDAIVATHSGQPLPKAIPLVDIDSPKTSDGKLIFQPSMFPGGVYLYITGAGDDGTRGTGQRFAVASDVEGDETVEFHFNDWVYLSSGGLMWQGAEFGDTVSFAFHCPASPVVPNAGGTGNCNLVPPYAGAPAILIVPAAGNGAYDVDLANANPIPAYGANDASIGYWNWSEPTTGKGTITPSSTPGAAGWFLFAVDMPLVRFANRVPLLGAGSMDMNPPPIKSKKMLPHWHGTVTLHNSGHQGLKVAWWLATARTVTT